MPNGDGGFDFGNAIPSIGDPQTNAILTIIVAILNAIIAVLNFIIAVIGAIVHFLVKASLLFVRGVKHVISDIVHGRFLHLYQDYLRLKAAIRKWIDDHLGWLLRLRAAFDRWFKNTIVPILNLIQRLRAVLAVFRIFHLKFADKLDRLLGRLESKIIRNTLKLRAKLNEIVTIIDLVLDPGLLINNNVLLASAARSIRALMNLVGLGFARALTDTELASQKVDHDRYKVANVVAAADQHASVGPSAELLLQQDEIRDALTDITGLPQGRFG